MVGVRLSHAWSALVLVLLALLTPLSHAGDEAYLQVKDVRVRQGRVQLIAIDNLEVALPDGDYSLERSGTRKPSAVRIDFRVRGHRIVRVERGLDVSAPPASIDSSADEDGAAARHPIVHTAWSRGGRLYLANRRGKQLPLLSGEYASNRRVVVTVTDGRITALRGPRNRILR